MLYLLYETLAANIKLFNIFQYISVRTIIAFFIAFFVTLFLMPRFIKWAMKSAAMQPIFDLAPDSHKIKSNTPTMGGVVFLFATFIAVLVSTNFDKYVFITLLLALLFALIGFIDDFSKIRHVANNKGLSTKQKLLLQWGFALIISTLLYCLDFDTNLYVPFFKHPLFDMDLFAVFFWAFVIVSASNAVNLTDGLDGLATVPSIFSLLSLTVILYVSGHAELRQYLYLPNLSGVGELTIVSFALIGSLIGFLWYNSHPAQVFMGDSGSLTLGAMIALFAIFAKSEILLIMIGFIFVLETLSVIIQVGSFKIRQKRVFKMAPIHHHFELKGWSENKIIIRFWIISFLTNLIAILTLKIR